MKPKTLLALGLLLALLSISFDLDPVYPRQTIVCSHPLVAEMLSLTSQAQWADWIEKLSGEETVLIGDENFTISTRHTRYIASGAANARAVPFVLEQLNAWAGDPAQIEEDPFQIYISSSWYTAHNVIYEIPGSAAEKQVVILSAHLDSTSPSASSSAPGAEDNASGSAALLEAARILRHYRFENDLRIIWFTGEEQGLVGSYRYVQDHDVSNVLGVVNLDMYGYDADNDRCFELHVGTLPESAVVGQCFTQGIANYHIPLKYDYLTTLAEGYSDHETFWDEGIGALEVLENYSDQGLARGCQGQDRNPYYHTNSDRIQYMNLPVGFDITRAGIAAAANLAGPIGPCFEDGNAPQLVDDPFLLRWQAVPGALKYRVYASSTGCDGDFSLQAETTQASWSDPSLAPGEYGYYKVEALAGAESGFCLSFQSSCHAVTPPLTIFLPMVSNQ